MRSTAKQSSKEASESSATAEHLRLAEDTRYERPWKHWGPYLSARQWGTVREDYRHLRRAGCTDGGGLTDLDIIGAG